MAGDRKIEGKSALVTGSNRGLGAALVEAGAGIEPRPDGAMEVSGLDGPRIGDLAASLGIAVHELTPQTASLEEAFMELTRDSVEFHGEGDPLALPADSLSKPGEDVAKAAVHQDLRP